MSTLTESLTGKIGGVPVWLIGGGIGATILGVQLWQRRGQMPPADAGAEVEPGSEPAGSDAFTAPWGPYMPGVYTGTTPATTTEASEPMTNEQWRRRALALLIARGIDPIQADAGLGAWFRGEQLTAGQYAAVQLALQELGPPPDPPGTPQLAPTPPAPSPQPAPVPVVPPPAPPAPVPTRVPMPRPTVPLIPKGIYFNPTSASFEELTAAAYRYGQATGIDLMRWEYAGKGNMAMHLADLLKRGILPSWSAVGPYLRQRLAQDFGEG